MRILAFSRENKPPTPLEVNGGQCLLLSYGWGFYSLAPPACCVAALGHHLAPRKPPPGCAKPLIEDIFCELLGLLEVRSAPFFNLRGSPCNFCEARLLQIALFVRSRKTVPRAMSLAVCAEAQDLLRMQARCMEAIMGMASAQAKRNIEYRSLRKTACGCKRLAYAQATMSSYAHVCVHTYKHVLRQTRIASFRKS